MAVASEMITQSCFLGMQSETEQRPHKVSFNVTKDKAQDVMKALATRLAERGV